jgi:type IV fimbrial biogenesis protein FimT
VVLVRTAQPTCTTGAIGSAGGVFWTVRTVEVLAGEGTEVLKCGALGESASGIAIAGPAVLCFNPGGRITANPDPGTGGAACAAGQSAFDVSAAGADRPLRVAVSLSGSARACDPAKPSSQPDACATP